jgi:hypothetical protein
LSPARPVWSEATVLKTCASSSVFIKLSCTSIGKNSAQRAPA